MTKPDNLLALPLTARGSLYRWMRAHRDEIAAAFKREGPCWDVRVAAFGKLGLLDNRGKPPTVKTTQNTWYRVVREAEREPAAEPPPPPRPQSSGFQARPFTQPSRLVDWDPGDVSRESNNADGTEPGLESLRAFARSIGANPIQVLRRIRDTPGVAEIVRVGGRPQWRITNPAALIEALRDRAGNGNPPRQPDPVWPPDDDPPTNPMGEKI